MNRGRGYYSMMHSHKEFRLEGLSVIKYGEQLLSLILHTNHGGICIMYTNTVSGINVT